MIALDTNVLIRFLVEDDPVQCRRARDLLRKCFRGNTPVYISEIVVCETVWVLGRAYHFGRVEIMEVLQKLVTARGIVLDSPDLVLEALELFKKGKGDLADYMILLKARAAGSEKVATFDKTLHRTHGFFSP